MIDYGFRKTIQKECKQHQSCRGKNHAPSTHHPITTLPKERQTPPGTNGAHPDPGSQEYANQGDKEGGLNRRMDIQVHVKVSTVVEANYSICSEPEDAKRLWIENQ